MVLLPAYIRADSRQDTRKKIRKNTTISLKNLSMILVVTLLAIPPEEKKIIKINHYWPNECDRF